MLVRTTLTLDDDLLQRLRQKAASENRAFKQVVNDVLRAGLALDREAPAYTFRLTTAEGRVMPGVDLTDRDKLFDLMDGR
jgi:plasmid stability protein